VLEIWLKMVLMMVATPGITAQDQIVVLRESDSSHV